MLCLPSCLDVGHVPKMTVFAYLKRLDFMFVKCGWFGITPISEADPGRSR